MATRKGVIITIIILSAVTLSSFLFWFIPQNSQTTFFVSDFESHLDGIKRIHVVVTENIDTEFQNVLNGTLTPEEYIEMAEASSSQINSLIIQLVKSEAPSEWHGSYLNYIESLKNSNSFIRETIVAANLLREGTETTEIDNIIQKINAFREESKSLIKTSDSERP